MNSRQKAKLWPYPRHKYFSREMRTAAAKWFREKQYPTQPRMPFCLARWADWPANIILKDVAGYVSARNAEAQQRGVPFPLHKWLHHGMSSQAMAFNLIGPLIVRNDFRALETILNAKGVLGATDIRGAVFEYEDREVFNEDTGQPTSIDIVLESASGRPCIFIESKFDEQEFGGCTVFAAGDCDGKNPIDDESTCLLHFIGRKYWDLMAKYGMSDSIRHDRQCPFTVYYQFFREVMFALEKGGTFVLLSDARSPVFQCRSGVSEKGLMPFLTSLLPDEIRNRVVSLTTQELVSEIELLSLHQDWIYEFKKKYGMA